MQILYYSDITNQAYKSEEALHEAEAAVNAKIEEQNKKDEALKAAIQKAEDAMHDLEETKKEINQLRINFNRECDKQLKEKTKVFTDAYKELEALQNIEKKEFDWNKFLTEWFF